MALTADQKKHLFIGGGVATLALIAGHAIFSARDARAEAVPIAPPPRRAIGPNARGAYGRRHHHAHHHPHHKEHGRD